MKGETSKKALLFYLKNREKGHSYLNTHCRRLNITKRDFINFIDSIHSNKIYTIILSPSVVPLYGMYLEEHRWTPISSKSIDPSWACQVLLIPSWISKTSVTFHVLAYDNLSTTTIEKDCPKFTTTSDTITIKHHNLFGNLIPVSFNDISSWEKSTQVFSKYFIIKENKGNINFTKISFDGDEQYMYPIKQPDRSLLPENCLTQGTRALTKDNNNFYFYTTSAIDCHSAMSLMGYYDEQDYVLLPFSNKPEPAFIMHRK